MSNSQIEQKIDVEVTHYHILETNMNKTLTSELKYQYLLTMFQVELNIAELCLQLDVNELVNIKK